jgi:hypothetical protein
MHTEHARDLLRGLQHVVDAVAAPGAPSAPSLLASASAMEDQLRRLLPYLVARDGDRSEVDRLLLVYRMNVRALAERVAHVADAPSRADADAWQSEADAQHAVAVRALGAIATLLGRDGASVRP